MSQEGVLFDKAFTKLIAFPNDITGQYDIPEGIEIVGESAFRQSSIDQVVFSSTVKVIEEKAFMESKLTSLQIPSNISIIHQQAFQWNEALISIEFESNPIEMGPSFILWLH